MSKPDPPKQPVPEPTHPPPVPAALPTGVPVAQDPQLVRFLQPSTDRYWTEDEDLRFQQAVLVYPDNVPHRWVYVSQFVTTRGPAECYNRFLEWYRVFRLSSAIFQTHVPPTMPIPVAYAPAAAIPQQWSANLDHQLCQLVVHHGYGEWELIGESMRLPGELCQRRYDELQQEVLPEGKLPQSSSLSLSDSNGGGGGGGGGMVAVKGGAGAGGGGGGAGGGGASLKDPRKRGRRRGTRTFRRGDPDDLQVDCCVRGCTNRVKNRLRFSLRDTHHYKQDYLDRNWNRVCSHHYFADLYKHKKSTHS